MRGQRGVGHTPHLRVGLKILNNLEGILDMTLNTQGQRLDSLKEYPCIEGRYCGSCISQYDGAYPCHKGRRASDVSEDCPVIRGVGLGYCRVLVRMGLEVEFSAINNDSP